MTANHRRIPARVSFYEVSLEPCNTVRHHEIATAVFRTVWVLDPIDAIRYEQEHAAFTPVASVWPWRRRYPHAYERPRR